MFTLGQSSAADLDEVAKRIIARERVVGASVLVARGQQIIFQYSDKDFSLTDATSFAVMERLRIGTAFSYDRHFAQYGFALLRPSARA